jgi:2-keto-4-pentenoate hydratase/2-oxohepta-3-ene-1,7-dioic acid hydratase in catechol pathway
MKLLRFGVRGHERPGLLDADGNVRDLSAHVRDLTPDALSPSALAALRALDPRALPAVPGSPRLAIGLNYADHAAEANLPLPIERVIFTKAISCLSGPNDDIMLPPDARKGDWEVELGLIIGRTTRHVTERDALDHVAGYVLANDVSERSYQLERGTQWDKGKGCDTFGPVGPWLTTPDEVPDPQALDLFLDLNGERMQSGNTRTMVFTVRQLVS